MKRLGRIFFAAFAACLLICSAGAAADGKIRLGVMPFSSRAESLTDAQAEIITDLLINALAGSKSIVVMDGKTMEAIGVKFGLEANLDNLSGAAEIGRIAGLQYVMLGFITELEKGPRPLQTMTGEISDISATIQARVVDVNTSEVVLALSESGTSSNYATAQGNSVLPILNRSLPQMYAAASAPVERESVHAISDAVWRMSHMIRTEIAGEYSYVVSEKRGKFTIDVGSELGARTGHLYLAYADGEDVLGIDGKPLAKEKTPLALLRVDRSEAGYSVCSAVLGNGDVVRRGDKIEPITADDAKKIAPELPKKRPEF
ncbi:MAG: CsgG/HfaB family protein [Synergistaceae bacterium]|jgi:curli biogenesis system outer membrane secretion channel CsgG|nr:CsgG/HfaB family protein [Synergistaceae bacterium]